MTSVSKMLGKSLGGVWTYRAPCVWDCDDGVRMVVRCSPGVDEWDNPLPGSECWLYGEGVVHDDPTGPL